MLFTRSLKGKVKTPGAHEGTAACLLAGEEDDAATQPKPPPPTLPPPTPLPAGGAPLILRLLQR